MNLLLILAALLTNAPTTVPQAWSTAGTKDGNIDSLAACRLPDGSVRVFATAKEGHCIDVLDATDGRRLRSLGKQGDGVGEFNYPNGIVAITFADPLRAVKEDVTPLILVIERDNHRVQAFHPDTLQPAGTFGADELNRPYGGAVSYRGRRVLLYVTDTEVPPAETVKVFQLRLSGDTVQARHLRSFGDTEGPGVVAEAESIVVDDRHDRVLLCDEKNGDVKVYDRAGKFTGRVFGKAQVEREPEGIAIYESPAGSFVILTDQQKALSVWHIFDRQTYAHRAAFTGQPTIANTDGICLYTEQFGPFPRGAFFAVHDDREVRAYPLEAILDIAK